MAAMSGKKYQEENNGWHKKWVNQRVPPIYAAWRSKIPVVCYADPSYHGRFQIQTLSHRTRFSLSKQKTYAFIWYVLKYCFKVIECLLRPIKPIVKWSWPLHQLPLPSLGYHACPRRILFILIFWILTPPNLYCRLYQCPWNWMLPQKDNWGLI